MTENSKCLQQIGCWAILSCARAPFQTVACRGGADGVTAPGIQSVAFNYPIV